MEKENFTPVRENKYVNKFFQKKTLGVLIFLKKNCKPH